MTVAAEQTGGAAAWLAQESQRLRSIVGPTKTFGTALDEAGPEQIPFVGVGFTAEKYAGLISAARAMESGTQSPEEEALLTEFALDTQRPTTFGYEVGKILTDAPGMIVEFLTGAGIGTVAAKKIGGRAVREALEKLATQKGLGAALKRVAAGTVPTLAGIEATQAVATTLAPGVPTATGSTARAQQLQLPGMQVVEEAGKDLRLVLDGQVRDFAEALPLGVLDQAIEVASELSGGAINEAAIGLGLGKLQRRVLGTLAEKLGSNRAAVARVTKEGWSGALGEWVEELVGHGARSAVGLPTAAPGLAELVAFSILGGGMQAATGALGTAPAEVQSTGAGTAETIPLEDPSAKAAEPAPPQVSERSASLLESLGHTERVARTFEGGVPVDAPSERHTAFQRAFEAQGADVVFLKGAKNARTRPAASYGDKLVVANVEALEDPEQEARLRWHEPVHLLRARFPEEYKQFAEAVAAISPPRARTSEEEYQAIFQAGDPGAAPLSPDLLAEEGMAYRVEGLRDWLYEATTPKGLKALEKAAQVPTVWRRIVRAIRRMLGLRTIEREDAMTALEAHKALQKLKGAQPPSATPWRTAGGARANAERAMERGTPGFNAYELEEERRRAGMSRPEPYVGMDPSVPEIEEAERRRLMAESAARVEPYRGFPAGTEAIELGPEAAPTTGTPAASEPTGIPEKPEPAPPVASMPTEPALFGEIERAPKPRRSAPAPKASQGMLLDVQESDLPGQQSLLEATEAKPAPAPKTETQQRIDRRQARKEARHARGGERAKYPSGSKTPTTTVDFVVQAGGLDMRRESKKGELRRLVPAENVGKGERYPSGFLIDERGKDARTGRYAESRGITLDELGERLVQQGFPSEEGVGKRPSHDEMLDWLEAELGGGHAMRSQAEQERYYASFDPSTDPDAPRFAAAPPFYSRMERAVESSPQARFSKDQAKALLKGSTKQEEYDWLGVDRWLEGRGRISKDELLDFIRAHKIQVEEVVFGEPMNRSDEEQLDTINEEMRLYGEQAARIPPQHVLRFRGATAEEVAEADRQRDDLRRRMDELEWLRATIKRDQLPTKHGQWQLPGGEGYRELLLTLPAGLRKAAKWAGGDRFQAVWDQNAGWIVEDQETGRTAERAETLTLASIRAEAYNAQRPEYRQDAERAADLETERGEHKSHAYDTPNILAWVRFNERTDAQGRRVLFVEEIQSDWHQTGREKGYRDEAAHRAFEDYSRELAAKYKLNPLQNLAMYSRIANMDPAEVERYEELQAAAFKGQGMNQVPDAPFKTTWPELALKRMVKWAADQGFDAVGWTTGATQVDRYATALRQVVDKIGWDVSTAGGKWVHASKHGARVLNSTIDDRGIVVTSNLQEAKGKPIEDLVGKEIAKRILSEPSGKVEGEGLTIGGKGMEGFYDQILPATARALGKRFGAKVERGQIEKKQLPKDAEGWGMPGMPLESVPGEFVHLLPLPESMRSEARERGFPMFAAAPPPDSPAFSKWFRSSKVVDDEGKPLVVYHSTHSDYTVLDPDRGIGSLGFHIGSAEQAQATQETGGTAKDVNAKRSDEGQRILPLYARIERPLRMKDPGAWYSFDVVDALDKLGIRDEAPLPDDARTLAGMDLPHLRGTWASKSDARKKYDVQRRLAVLAFYEAHPDASRERIDDAGRKASDLYVRGLIEAAGYDGIVYDNIYEGGGDSWIAFRPEQIKSATGNRGTYDPADPDIRFAAAPPRIQLALEDLRIPASVAAFAQRNLTSRGDLPESVFKRMIERDSRVNATIQNLRHGARDFRVALREVYGSVKKAPMVELDAALRDDAAVSALDPRLHDPMRAMRAHLDALSQAMIDTGVVEGDLAAHIAENMGVYLTRSYRVFDDPDWMDKVDPEVRNKAKALLRSEYPDYTDDQIEGLINSLLVEGKAADSPMALIARSKLGAKDLSILQRRTGISPEIRALYGEYQDPLVNYARSATKMAHLIANHQFLESVREAGTAEGWLTALPTAKNHKKIAATASEVMFPLNGLYTTPEIETAFREAVEKEHIGPLFRGYLRINGLVKGAKTVGSVMSQVRNFFGNVGFAVANGHYRVGKLANSVRGVLTELHAMNDETWRAYTVDAIRHGVQHEGANSQELRATLNDALTRDIDSVLLDGLTPLHRAARFLVDIYQANDDFWKLYAWENEKARYAEAYPEWTEEQVASKAAEIVRNTYPTYSLVPRAIRKLRRFPLVGSFVSFPSEVFRTAKNTIQLIRTELADPATRTIGAQRLAGTVMAATAMAGLAAASRFLMGITGDDDEAFRQFVPPWSRNASIVYVGRSKDGNPLWIDASFTDPYAYLKRPLAALLRGDGPFDAGKDALSELLEPFLGEEILAGALVDVARNKKKTGGEVYNEAGSSLEQAADITAHIGKTVEPGTLSSMRRVYRGLTDYVTPYGQDYDPKIEALAAIGGVRVAETNVAQALQFHGREYQRRLADATRMLSSVAKREGRVSEGEVRDAFESMERARRAAFEDASEAVRAAIALGLPRRELLEALEASMSKENALGLINGRYRQHETRRGQYTPQAMSTVRALERAERAAQ